MERRGFKHGCDMYSGGKHLGYTLKIFTDSVRVSYVARHREKFLDQHNEEEG